MSRASDMGPLPMNWRDVGLALRTRTGCIASLPSGRLLRSGQLDFGLHSDFILRGCGVRTIVNLRMMEDDGPLPQAPGFPAPAMVHVPAANTLEKYETSDPAVAKWVAAVLCAVSNAEPPVLVHCRSGKDRTGVIVAAILRVMAAGDEPITDDDICFEFALSEGTDVARIQCSLDGFGPSGGTLAGSGRAPAWLRGVDTAKLRRVVGGHGEGAGTELQYVRAATKALHGLVQRHAASPSSGATVGGPAHASLICLMVQHAAREVQLIEQALSEREPRDFVPLASALAKQGWALQSAGDHTKALEAFDKAPCFATSRGKRSRWTDRAKG